MRNIEEIKADINLCTGCMTNRHDCDENCNDCLYINYDKNYYRLRQENYNWYKDRDSRAKAISGIKTSRLEEICNAEREGRCVVLPCKVGDTVWYIPQYGGKPYCGAKEGHAQHITLSSRHWRIQVREHHPHNTDFVLGKTVFLTREEAEAALAKEGEAP